MAFDMLKDEKFRKKIERQRAQEMDAEERSRAIKTMFASIGRVN